MLFRSPLLIGGQVVLANPSPTVDQEVLASIDKVPPPPKSIDDLVKLLNASRPDPESIRKKEAIADAQPPAGMVGEQLYFFYKERAKAAEGLSRVKQLKEDCRLELQYVGSDKDLQNDARRDCIQAEFLDGNPLKAVELLKEALSKIPAGQSYG